MTRVEMVFACAMVWALGCNTGSPGGEPGLPNDPGNEVPPSTGEPQDPHANIDPEEVCAGNEVPPPAWEPQDERYDPATILTLRIQDQIALDTELRDCVQALLERAYEADPQLIGISAWPQYQTDSVIIQTERSDVAAAWSDGCLQTGVAALDELLAMYGAVEGWMLQRYGVSGGTRPSRVDAKTSTS